MNIFGIGGFELLIIIAVATLIIGPRRVTEMLRDARKVYSELKRQRENLTSMVSEEMAIEELRKESGINEVSEAAAVVREELALPKNELGELQTVVRSERLTMLNLLSDDEPVKHSSDSTENTTRYIEQHSDLDGDRDHPAKVDDSSDSIKGSLSGGGRG